MGKIQKTLCTFNRFTDHVNASRNTVERTPLEPTSINKIVEKLREAIRDKDIDLMRRLLNQDFVTNLGEPAVWTHKGNHHERYQVNQSYTAEPMIEVLFFRHNPLFQSLIFQIVHTLRDQEFHDVFILSMIHSDIPSTILTGWDESEQAQIQAGLQALKDYEGIEGSERKNHVIDLHDKLQSRLQSQPSVEGASHSLAWLDYKFQTLRLLHSKDQYFTGHMGYKRLLVNLATIILSGAVLNLLNYAVTGNFFFFNQTTSQTLIADLDKNMHPEELLMQAVTLQA